MDLDTTLAALAADPRLDVDLAELALHLARDEYPDLDVSVYLARLDDLADRLQPRLTGRLAADAVELVQLLFADEEFSGNQADYYDPRNSYLNDVLDRKAGLPITLSLVAAAVGTRAGLTVEGVGLPGHFVAKVVGEDGSAVFFDPFHAGRFLDKAACEELVEGATGRPFTLTPDAAAASPSGAVAVRLLTNLKSVYLKAADFARAARVTERLVVLLPQDADQRRDLGVCLIHAGRAGRAVPHLRAYLAAAPAAADAATVREFLSGALREVAKWN
jgi:regulator of sirC expression with transglutaminase-like and TPR domain